MSQTSYDLDRFMEAQEAGNTYARARSELEQGRKVSHWMWFVFPQVAGLGRSSMAQRYAISSLAEAQAYLAHPVLGQRLRDCGRLLTRLPGGDAEAVFGPVDALKLRSSMTLFARADPGEKLFDAVLEQYFEGAYDPATDERLGQPPER